MDWEKSEILLMKVGERGGCVCVCIYIFVMIQYIVPQYITIQNMSVINKQLNQRTEVS